MSAVVGVIMGSKSDWPTMKYSRNVRAIWRGL